MDGGSYFIMLREAMWATESDMDFVAHARTDIPALCDEVEQLRLIAEAAEYDLPDALKGRLAEHTETDCPICVHGEWGQMVQMVEDEMAERDAILARAEKAEAALARVEALADQYGKDARVEGHGGELWSTTEAAIRNALKEALDETQEEAR